MGEISIEDMLKAGVHFGHQTKYWNPKMEPYIFGVRNKIHIIDLVHSVELLKPALAYVKSIAQRNNKVLFVGTKRSATKIVMEEATRCGMPYVNERWLGGMLTNYKTVRSSIRRLEDLLRQKEDGTFLKLTKKERLKLQREIDKLQKAIGGVREMGGLPDAIFVIDVKREAIAISEASKMGIPIVGIVDTNSSPEKIDYFVPGNDDAIRSISLFTRAFADACLEGLKLSTGLKADEGEEEVGPKIILKENKESEPEKVDEKKKLELKEKEEKEEKKKLETEKAEKKKKLEPKKEEKKKRSKPKKKEERKEDKSKEVN